MTKTLFALVFGALCLCGQEGTGPFPAVMEQDPACLHTRFTGPRTWLPCGDRNSRLWRGGKEAARITAASIETSSAKSPRTGFW